MTDQPTHTSSLEEARRRVERAWYLYDGCVDRDEVEAAVKAFARAEVIREVEAVQLSNQESVSYVQSRWGTRHGDERERLVSAYRAGFRQARLRALSQGGEADA